jgi:alpha-N-acetylglucosamine transferase
LRLLGLTEYDKICFIDADQLIVAPLEDVFDDVASNITQTLDQPEQLQDDEPPLPINYVFGSCPDTFSADHTIPPAEDDYLNAGFYVFQPSMAMFDYYTGLLRIENRFEGRFPEQDLFNYAHRRDGNMPWRSLDYKWNTKWPTGRDFEAGVRSFHGKYFDSKKKHDPGLRKIWIDRLEELEAFHEERDKESGATA